MRSTLRRFLRFFSICFLGGASLHLSAQDYPNRPMSVYVGTAAGSSADLLVRYFAERLRSSTGQPVIVENRAGAFGNIAASAVAKARPDGYTMLIAPNVTFVVSPYMFKELPFDPVQSFVPVGTLTMSPFVLVVDSQKPGPASVAELTILLKIKGKMASFGAPSGISLAAAEMYRSLVGAEAVQIPYKSMQQALLGLTNGDIDFVFSDSTNALARGVRYRPLAVSTEKRSVLAPVVPTMVEAGVAGFQSIPVWFAAAFPAGTPSAIADRMNVLFAWILASEETAKFTRNLGSEVFPGSRQDMANFPTKEIASWARLSKLANIEPQ